MRANYGTRCFIESSDRKKKCCEFSMLPHLHKGESVMFSSIAVVERCSTNFHGRLHS